MPFFSGLMLGLAYVAPIGAQNMFVINSALTKNKKLALVTTLVVILFDISLALACYFGVGLLINSSLILKNLILLGGGIFLLYLAISLLKSSWKSQQISLGKATSQETNLRQIICASFAISWLNPHALIDGSLLLGGMKAGLAVDEQPLFILGVMAASFSWFLLITLVIIFFKNLINNKVLRAINLICGLAIFYFGLKLISTLWLN